MLTALTVVGEGLISIAVIRINTILAKEPARTVPDQSGANVIKEPEPSFKTETQALTTYRRFVRSIEDFDTSNNGLHSFSRHREWI
jgi:hypothetical protein